MKISIIVITLIIMLIITLLVWAVLIGAHKNRNTELDDMEQEAFLAALHK